MLTLLTVCNNNSMKNVIKCLNQLNHRGSGTSTVKGILFSLNRSLIISFNKFFCLLFRRMTD